MPHTRHVPLQGAPNVRDLGGHRTTGGRTVSRGRLFRSGALSTLTDADVDTVAGLKLHTVLDFRTPGEIRAGGPDRLPPGVETVHLPIGGGNLDRLYDTAVDADVQWRLLGEGRGEQTLIDINRGFVANADERAQFAVALHRIAEPGALPLLFHCTAGKDRTGWLAAIVLTALGVPREAVLEDFLASNASFTPFAEEQLRRLADSGVSVDVALFRPLIEQRASYLEAAFDEADGLYGSFEAFLHDGLDIGEDALARWRTELLD